MRDMQCTAFASAGKEPRLTPVRPHGHQQLIRIGRVDDHVRHTGTFIRIQHVLPALASVCCFVHSTIRTVPPSRSCDSDPNGLMVCRMDDDPVNIVGVFKAHHFP